MSDYTDVHTHILPRVDDGAENLAMSMKMLLVAQENGINRIFLTPHNKPGHHNAGPQKIRELTEKLQAEIKKNGLSIKLYTGNEIYYRSDALRLLEEKEACTMADSDYVLLEFGPMDDFEYIRTGIYQIQTGGYRPILAHVERYSALLTSPEKVRTLMGMGCYIQVNSGSIMGKYGFGTKRYCRQLLKQGLVHFVATDAHDDGKRAPCLLECAEYIDRKFGGKLAEKIFVENPSHVIANEYI